MVSLFSLVQAKQLDLLGVLARELVMGEAAKKTPSG